jgi:hypothetical protein
MRLAGYNANSIGIEPMNGMGIYSASGALAAQWIITQQLSVPATLAVSWNIRQLVAQAAWFPWSIRAFVSAGNALAWDVRQFVTNGASFPWAIREFVVASRGVIWDVRQFAAQSISASWVVRAFVSAASGLAWDVRQVATQAVSFVWDVGASVVATLAAKWRVPFLPRTGTSLARTGAASSLTPHTATSTLFKG